MAMGKIVEWDGAKGRIADFAVARSEARADLWVSFQRGDIKPKWEDVRVGYLTDFSYNVAEAKRRNLVAAGVKVIGERQGDASNDDRVKGIVVKFLPDRGIGFIRDAEQKLDYHFHQSDIDSLPTIGMSVTFQRDVRDGKTKARNVRVAA